jgi:hypothetical protein
VVLCPARTHAGIWRRSEQLVFQRWISRLDLVTRGCPRQWVSVDTFYNADRQHRPVRVPAASHDWQVIVALSVARFSGLPAVADMRAAIDYIRPWHRKLVCNVANIVWQ